MQIKIEYTQKELKDLIQKDLEEKLGSIPLDASKISIQVKSAQNYKSEWEVAHFRATYEHVA